MAAQKRNPSAELVCIVDGQDRMVRIAGRDEMREDGLLHRVTFVLVFNARGEILVQTRTMSKDWYPGRIDLAAGGVMTAEESYEESARRELQEELGIRSALDFEFKIYFEDNNSSPSAKSWGSVYSCLSEGPFALQPEEVDRVCFMTVSEALKIPADRTTPDTRLVLRAYAVGRYQAIAG